MQDDDKTRQHDVALFRSGLQTLIDAVVDRVALDHRRFVEDAAAADHMAALEHLVWTLVDDKVSVTAAEADLLRSLVHVPRSLWNDLTAMPVKHNAFTWARVSAVLDDLVVVDSLDVPPH